MIVKLFPHQHRVHSHFLPGSRLYARDCFHHSSPDVSVGLSGGGTKINGWGAPGNLREPREQLFMCSQIREHARDAPGGRST